MKRHLVWIASTIAVSAAFGFSSGCGGSGLTQELDLSSIKPVQYGSKIVQPGESPSESKTKKGGLLIP